MDLWVFDSDGTLYDDTNAHDQFEQLFTSFCVAKFGLKAEEVKGFAQVLKDRYKTTSSVVALVQAGRVSFQEIVEATYLRINLHTAILLDQYSHKAILKSLPGYRILFTNSPSEYACRVLTHMGLSACFDQIVGMQEMGFHLKPDSQAFQIVEDFSFGTGRIIYCDDLPTNLDVASQLGWQTIWFQPSDKPNQKQQRHSVIHSFSELLLFV